MPVEGAGDSGTEILDILGGDREDAAGYGGRARPRDRASLPRYTTDGKSAGGAALCSWPRPGPGHCGGGTPGGRVAWSGDRISSAKSNPWAAAVATIR